MPTICACWDSLSPGYFVHPRTRCLMSLIVLNKPLSLGCLYGAHSPACTWRMWYGHCWLLIRSPLSPAKSKPSLHEYSNYGERSKSPLNHTVCHATVFSYYAPSGEDPTSGVDIVKCGLCRSVRGFEQKTEEIGIIRLVGTRIKSTYIRHAAAFVNAALRSIQSYSIQWYQFHVFSKQTNLENVTHESPTLCSNSLISGCLQADAYDVSIGMPNLAISECISAQAEPI
ncbi:hypothetical protein BDW68DRAFT_33343 [Aspergillus falconensis]